MKNVYVVIYEILYEGYEILCIFDERETATSYIHNKMNDETNKFVDYGLICVEIGKVIDMDDVEWFTETNINTEGN